MATYKQVRYYRWLLTELGEAPSKQQVQQFAGLSVVEASARITELEKRHESQKAAARGTEEPQ